MPFEATEDPFRWPLGNLLYLRTPWSATPTKKKVRRIDLSKRGRKSDFDLERGEKEKREDVSRAVARVLRHENVNDIWFPHNELGTTFKKMMRFRNVDDRVLTLCSKMLYETGKDL